MASAVPRVDRTAEFFAISDAQCGGQPPRRRKPPRSDLATAASAIGRDLHAAGERIRRLERLSKDTSLFNDPVVEIDQLKLLIKQDVHRLGGAIDSFARAHVDGRQPALHRDGIAASLRLTFSRTTGEFQKALAQREASLVAREQRAARLASVAQTPSLPLATSSALHRRPAHARAKRPAANGGVANLTDVEAGGGGNEMYGGADGGGGGQQQTFWAPRSLREREAAMSTMQSTLSVRARRLRQGRRARGRERERASRLERRRQSIRRSRPQAQLTRPPLPSAARRSSAACSRSSRGSSRSRRRWSRASTQTSTTRRAQSTRRKRNCTNTTARCRAIVASYSKRLPCCSS
jgi:hypothetical protein